MAELVDRDQEHLKLLKMGFYLLAGTAGFSTLFALLFMALGTIVGFSAPASTRGGPGNDPPVMGAVLAGLGLAFLLLGAAWTWLTYYAARSIEVRRRWIFCMILAALWCLSIPFGTAIGISAILVLNRPSVKVLFEEHAELPLSS